MAEIEWKSDPKITGENIKKRRKALHMTQTELAEYIGGSMNNRTISLYERGKCVMGIQVLYDFVDALQTTPDQLAPERYRKSGNTDPRLDKLSELFSGLDEKSKEYAYQGIQAMLIGYDVLNKDS